MSIIKTDRPVEKTEVATPAKTENKTESQPSGSINQKQLITIVIVVVVIIVIVVASVYFYKRSQKAKAALAQ